MSDFTDHGILITGGAGGIGAVAARAFLKRGAKVAIVDIGREALESTRDSLKDAGDVTIIQADVSNEADVKRYVAEAIEALGSIDVFLNNAAIEGHVGPLLEQPIEDFDRVIAINLRGAFLGMKYVLAHMVERGCGSVINTSSTAGLGGAPGLSPYSASKHGVVGITKTVALEIATSGVRVNSIHPSAVNTRMIHAIEAGGQADRLKTSIPLGHYAEPSDIVNMMLFLAADESAFITGAQFRVDGGLGAK